MQICSASSGIVIPIPLDHRSHPSKYNLSGIYIFLLNNLQKYYIPIDHSEALKTFTLKEITGAIDTPHKKYVHDIKTFNHNFNLKNTHCCNSMVYFNSGKKINQDYTAAHNKLYSMYWMGDDTLQELADKIGISKSTVFIAIKKIRKHMKEVINDPFK